MMYTAREHTNIFKKFFYSYAQKKIEELRATNKLTSHSRFKKWIPITIIDLYGFLAIVLNMGIIRAPEIEDYWRRSWVSEITFFSRVMPRDRFELIFWMLHVSHADTGTVRRIDKVRLLLEKIVDKFQQNYTPGREISVDETMLKFRGRFVAQQYMPKNQSNGE